MKPIILILVLLTALIRPPPVQAVAMWGFFGGDLLHHDPAIGSAWLDLEGGGALVPLAEPPNILLSGSPPGGGIGSLFWEGFVFIPGETVHDLPDKFGRCFVGIPGFPHLCAHLDLSVQLEEGVTGPVPFGSFAGFPYDVTYARIEGTGLLTFPNGRVVSLEGRGRGTLTGGDHGYLAVTFDKPVSLPEPATVLLMAGGLGLLALGRRKKGRQADTLGPRSISERQSSYHTRRNP